MLILDKAARIDVYDLASAEFFDFFRPYLDWHLREVRTEEIKKLFTIPIYGSHLSANRFVVVYYSAFPPPSQMLVNMGHTVLMPFVAKSPCLLSQLHRMALTEAFLCVYSTNTGIIENSRFALSRE
ncbi:unnamed protein product [Cylicostephanus goldi]|uniref:Uncharacterized protein n=1 Tax=Cylicostephanus goldi TaxID=71465 RepID=A0A3P6RSC0_CYLGO|nr:unnamed protein product [Cylicostephanus goldi]